jgi:hypothetical protein
VAGLVGWIAFGEILPGCSGAKYPEDAVENIAWVSPGSASTIFSSRWVGHKRLQHFPLLIGEVHALLLLLKGHAQ